MIGWWVASTMPGSLVSPSLFSAFPQPGSSCGLCPGGLGPFGPVEGAGLPAQKLGALASPFVLVLLLLPVLAFLLLLVLGGALLLLLLFLPPEGLQGGAGGQSGSSPLPQPEPLLVLL